jgi:hypothetical protein
MRAFREKWIAFLGILLNSAYQATESCERNNSGNKYCTRKFYHELIYLLSHVSVFHNYVEMSTNLHWAAEISSAQSETRKWYIIRKLFQYYWSEKVARVGNESAWVSLQDTNQIWFLSFLYLVWNLFFMRSYGMHKDNCHWHFQVES